MCAYKPVEIPQFGGLNLRDDPQEVGWTGAVDLLNVDFADRGRIRTRNGYTQFNAASLGVTYKIAPYVSAAGVRQLVVGNSAGVLYGLAANGTTVASQSAGSGNVMQGWAQFERAGSNWLYVATPSGAGPYVWNGVAWTDKSATFGSTTVGFAMTSDFRLAIASPSRVKFSEPAGPETLGVNDFVDLSPGDGEDIVALRRWRELLFVFKQTKFFVFYGNTTDQAGDTLFNYRTVETGVGLHALSPEAVCAGPDGLYFAGRDGLYRSSGGPPQRVATTVDALWEGNLPPAYAGYPIDPAQFQSLEYLDGRLYFSYLEQTSAERRVLVLDLRTSDASVWDMDVNDMVAFNVGNDYERPDLYITTNDAASVVGVIADVDTDDGVAVSGRYRTGYSDLGDAASQKTVREWLVAGCGSPSLKVAVDDGSLDTGAAVALGTAPVVDQAVRRYAARGRNFSVQLTGTAPWSASRLVAHVRGQRTPGRDDG